MAHALRTCSTNCFRSSALPMAEPPPVGGQTGATTDPTTNPDHYLAHAYTAAAASRTITVTVTWTALYTLAPIRRHWS